MGAGSSGLRRILTFELRDMPELRTLSRKRRGRAKGRRPSQPTEEKRAPSQIYHVMILHGQSRVTGGGRVIHHSGSVLQIWRQKISPGLIKPSYSQSLWMGSALEGQQRVVITAASMEHPTPTRAKRKRPRCAMRGTMGRCVLSFHAATHISVQR